MNSNSNSLATTLSIAEPTTADAVSSTRDQAAEETAVRSFRFWEIDMLRGIAIIMVVIYHLAWDLYALAGWDINLFGGFWHYFQRVTANTFIILVGVSMTVSYRRARQAMGPDVKIFPKYLRRGVTLLAWGMSISLVTWLALGKGYVQFGILHFIGLSIIIAYPLLRFRYLNLALALVVFFLLPPLVNAIAVNNTALVWLGISPPGYYAVDYFPLIPWFSGILLGLFLGNWLYSADGRRFLLPDWSQVPGVGFLQLLGRHTLLIYLIHQPIVIALLILTGVVDIGALL